MRPGTIFKNMLWRVFGSSISALVALYVNDTRYAHDKDFASTWHANGLVLASLRQDYDASMLEPVAELLANHAWRMDLFDFWQQHGFSIYPQSHMSPFPRKDEIPDAHWEDTRPISGIDMNPQGQFEMLERVFPLYSAEFSRLSGRIPELPAWNPHNSYFSTPDTEVLYCFIRHFQPKKVLEIGSGNSTLVMSLAVERNQAEGAPTRITAVDPEPRTDIRLLSEKIYPCATAGPDSGHERVSLIAAKRHSFH